MRNIRKKASVSAIIAAFAAAPGIPVVAAESEDLEQRVEQMEKRLGMVEKEATAAERATTKWHLAGYTDVGFISSTADDDEDSFEVGHFNPVFHWLYKDFLLVEAELQFELEDGDTTVDLEYADINYFVNDRLTLVAGKYLSPVGQFQERLHPTWVNKLPTPPAGFGHGGVQPLSDVGIQARGGIPVGNATLTYSVAVGNGPQGGHHGPELEGFGEDNNSDKAVSGRVGFLPMPNVEFGASFLTAKIPGEEAPSGPVTEGDLDLWGLDAAYTPGPWDVRVEYLNSTLGEHFSRAGHGDETSSLIPETEWEAWYVQGARQFGKWEPVVRYGEFEAQGNPDWIESARKEWTVGLNYLFAPSVIGKVAFQTVEPDEGEDFDRYLVQLAYGF